MVWALVALLPLLLLRLDKQLTMSIMADVHALSIKGDHNWPQGNLVGKELYYETKRSYVCFHLPCTE